MALSTYAGLKKKMRFPTQLWPHSKSGTITTGEHWNSEWLTAAGIPGAGVAPTTGAVPDNTTAGSLGQPNPTGAQDSYLAWLRRYETSVVNGVAPTMFMLVDRLSHMGGLSGTVTTAQTATTGALTRFTGGVDVWAALEIYTAIGATQTTATASYTNSGSTAGRTSQAINFGGSGFNNQRGIYPLTVQAGDVGVISVQTVTLLATTGTAGNFGVTLYKTLAIYPCLTSIPVAFRGDGPELGIVLPNVPNGACLQLLAFGAGQVTYLGQAEVAFLES